MEGRGAVHRRALRLARRAPAQDAAGRAGRPRAAPRRRVQLTTSLVLDTDIGGDADDALALALCVRHPDIDLRAVTTVSGHARRRAGIAAGLLRRAGREDVEVAVGRSGPLPADRHDPELDAGEGVAGPGAALSDRDAVDVLLEAGRRAWTIATVGPQSNVAAAVDAGLAEARLAVMGGVFAPLEVYGDPVAAGADYNLNVDPEGSVRSLNADLPTLYTPCDVTFGTFLRRAHVDALRHGDDLCRALAGMIDAWTPSLRRFHPSLPDDILTMMHDPLAVAAAVDGSLVTVEPLPVTVALHDGHVRTFVDPVEGRLVEVVRSVDAGSFADWFLDVVLSP